MDVWSGADQRRGPAGSSPLVLAGDRPVGGVSDGDTLTFDGYVHEEYVELFHQIDQDAETRVVILTGAGDAFIDRIDGAGFDVFPPRGYDKIFREGRKLLANLLDTSAPVIAALNGPTTVHSEFILLSDIVIVIVIAMPSTTFQDKPHFAFGIIPAMVSSRCGRTSSARSAAAISSCPANAQR